MRWVFCSLFALALASPASAADLDIPPPAPVDYDTLRGSLTVGPATFTRWSGFYVGGQIGLSNGNANFSNSTTGIVSYLLRETALEDEFTPSQWPVLGTANNSAPSYGGFFGYNTQWQDLVLGVEANLNRANLFLNAPSIADRTATTATDSLRQHLQLSR